MLPSLDSAKMAHAIQSKTGFYHRGGRDRHHRCQHGCARRSGERSPKPMAIVPRAPAALPPPRNAEDERGGPDHFVVESPFSVRWHVQRCVFAGLVLQARAFFFCSLAFRRCTELHIITFRPTWLPMAIEMNGIGYHHHFTRQVGISSVGGRGGLVRASSGTSPAFIHSVKPARQTNTFSGLEKRGSVSFNS